ncbi:MAG: conjugal transfer protein TrbL, partial [Aliarcobacter butzleri]
SVSLYAPFTLLFGLISVQTSEFTINVTHAIQADFQQNVMYIFALIIVQAITALAIFKIPNIINQVIGSSNEGSSLTSGVGTLSAGGAIVSAFSKYTGLKYSAQAMNRTVTSAGGIANKLKETLANKIQIR